MNENPKRSGWQLHFSTLIIVVIVAGFLLYPNVCFSACDEESVVRGWPYAFGEKPVNPRVFGLTITRSIST